MAYKVHKIVGRATGQGFQFNYPAEGWVFDITNQRCVFLTTGLSDEALMQMFISQMNYGHQFLEGLWRDIQKVVLTK